MELNNFLLAFGVLQKHVLILVCSVIWWLLETLTMTKPLVKLFRAIQFSEAARSSLAYHKADKNKLSFL